MGRFATTWGFPTLGVGTAFDLLGTARPNHHQTGYQSRIWHQSWRAARLRSQPQTVFMCIGSGIEEMARTIARWWFGLRRRRHPTVALTICWWHFAVCDIFRWSSPDCCLWGKIWKVISLGRGQAEVTLLSVRQDMESHFTWQGPSRSVGLALNASKTKILTTQAQPGKTVTTQNGLEMEILDATTAQKWLGCLLSTLNAGNREAALDFPLQATSKTFYANKWILCDKNVSLNSRIKFFDSVVTSVVRFGAGQRKLYKSEIRKLDVHCRKLLRQVVGPSQVKSAPTPVGEPNVRAEAEKKNLYMYIPMTVQFAGVSQKTW